LRLRLGTWTLVGVAVVLAARALVYALVPSQTLILAELEHKTGGPRLTGIVLGVLVLAAALAAAVLWLAAIAVRERLALEARELVERPRLDVRRLALRAVSLFVCTSLAFALLESTIHWRAGLGWHGIHCLLGPVHGQAIGVLVGLSLLAVAIHGAIEHLLAWARRLVALLAARLPRLPGAARTSFFEARPSVRRVEPATAPRGPPRDARFRVLSI
jgi:hypothetical protein